MRFKHQRPSEEDLARVGSRRTVRVFLFFPTTIGDETRWLETASVLQECQLRPVQEYAAITGMSEVTWVNIAWAESASTK